LLGSFKGGRELVERLGVVSGIKSCGEQLPGDGRVPPGTRKIWHHTYGYGDFPERDGATFQGVGKLVQKRFDGRERNVLLTGLCYVCNELIAVGRRRRRAYHGFHLLPSEPRRHKSPALLQRGLQVLENRRHPAGRNLLGQSLQGFVEKRGSREVALGKSDGGTQ